jgi:hypothetical protein
MLLQSEDSQKRVFSSFFRLQAGPTGRERYRSIAAADTCEPPAAACARARGASSMYMYLQWSLVGTEK